MGAFTSRISLENFFPTEEFLDTENNPASKQYENNEDSKFEANYSLETESETGSLKHPAYASISSRIQR